MLWRTSKYGQRWWKMSDTNYEQLEFDFDYAEEQWRKINDASV
jgi:hypothetical protein